MAADSDVVHARGGDGQTPLHFASTVEVAEFLLANGAEIDALDVDHESTPAQYMMRVDQKRHYPRDRQDVARYLVSRGCKTDILMAAALGDVDLVRQHLDRDPGCIRMSVSDEWFPRQHPKAAQTIYLWTLGAHRTAHTVAREFGLSVSHFSRAFRATVGVAPHSWLLMRRIELAKDKIREGRLPLWEVALACGFSDQSHLTRVFTRKVGVSPGAWRRARDE